MFNYVFNTGSDISTFDGKSKKIVCKWKDAKVKDDMLCNIVLTVLGICDIIIGINCITAMGFRKGCRSFEQAEYDVLKELDLFTHKKGI